MSRSEAPKLEPRPPSFLSRSMLAAELDIGESTVDELVRRGILPKPVYLSAWCVRWCWRDVENSLASLKEGGKTTDSDPYAVGASNVTKIPEGRRDAANRRS